MADASSLSAPSFLDHLWVSGHLLVIAVAFALIWLRREKDHYRSLKDMQDKHEADFKELIRLHEIRIKNMEKAHEHELYILRNAKNLVWFRVGESGEVWRCPGCGYTIEKSAGAN